MKLHEAGLMMKSLLNATDEEIRAWIQIQHEVPAFLEEAFDTECRDGCKYYSAKSHGGCREIDCFKSLYSDITELRSAIIFAIGKAMDWNEMESMS